MKRTIHIFIFMTVTLAVCAPLSAQGNKNRPEREDGFEAYPGREVSVDCNPGEHYQQTPGCYVIQTRDEFEKFCFGGKSHINFFGEILIGVHVEINRGSSFHYDVMINKETKEIRIVAHYHCGTTRDRKIPVRLWLVIPKPIGNYEINFDVVNTAEINFTFATA